MLFPAVISSALRQVFAWGRAQILKGLPFFANTPEALFDRMLASGQLIMYTAGDVIWRPEDKQQKGKDKGASPAGGIPQLIVKRTGLCGNCPCLRLARIVMRSVSLDCAHGC